MGESSLRADATEEPKICLFPRCIDSEGPDYCGKCGDLPSPYDHEYGANAGRMGE